MTLKTRILSCLLVLLLLCGVLLSFTSCGGEEAGDASLGGAPSVEKNESTSTGDSEKVITEMTVYAVTDEFDASHARLKSETASFGGYVANSSVSYEENSGNYLRMTIKIPSEKASAFADALAEYLDVQSSNLSSNDVTTQYIDAESRIKALESERDTLQAIMEETSDYNDMMVVSKRLYEVIAELETQKALLASLDNRIAYSTIYLTLSESEEEVSGTNDGFFTRLGREFMNSLDLVGRFFTALGVLVLGNIPILLPLAAFTVGIVFLCRFLIKRSDKRYQEKYAEYQKNNPTQNNPKS